MAATWAPPTGDLAHNPGMCPDWELNWWPFGSQAGAQSTELHQPGPKGSILLTHTHNPKYNMNLPPIYKYLLQLALDIQVCPEKVQLLLI